MTGVRACLLLSKANQVTVLNMLRKPWVCSVLLLLALSLPFGPAFAGVQAPGVSNFQTVNDHVYRGGQPTVEGFKSLAKLGVKTVLDLRESGARARAEAQTVTALGMRYVNMPMKGMRAPTDQQIVKVLALLDDPSAGPVFIHCRRGSDRTGTVIACYRIAHDRWQNHKALKEAKSYGMSWIEFGMQHYIRQYMTASQNVSPAAAASAGVAASQ